MCVDVVGRRVVQGGKTESTKIVLRYLTTVGSTAQAGCSWSSRFIELNFNKRGHLIGGTIRTYLLEKVRLPCQQPGERNFHMFHEMYKGGTEEEHTAWHMSPMQDYGYTSQGGHL